MSPMSETQTETETALDASVRCDKCGAQAYVEAFLVSGLTLTFCAHHWTAVAPSIQDKLVDFNDHTHVLIASVKAQAETTHA